MKNLNYALIVVLALLAIITLGGIARADIEGTSTGTATVAAIAPTITYAGLWDSTDATNKNNTSIDVWTEYHINCTVNKSNTLIDLLNVTFRIWETTYSTVTGTDSNVNHYTYIYSNATDAFDEVGPDGSGNSHLISGSCTKPSDRSATSGNYKLAFKLHKTGNYTATKTWTANITAYDSSDNTGSNQTVIFGVTFYLELTVDDATHGWSTVQPNTSDNLIDSPADSDIDCTVTANGPFKLQARGSGNLANATNTIGLGNVTIHKDTLGSSISLTANYADIGGLTNISPDASLNEAFKLWIDVPDAQPTGDYTYTLYVQGVQQT